MQRLRKSRGFLVAVEGHGILLTGRCCSWVTPESGRLCINVDIQQLSYQDFAFLDERFFGVDDVNDLYDACVDSFDVDPC